MDTNNFEEGGFPAMYLETITRHGVKYSCRFQENCANTQELFSARSQETDDIFEYIVGKYLESFNTIEIPPIQIMRELLHMLEGILHYKDRDCINLSFRAGNATMLRYLYVFRPPTEGECEVIRATITMAKWRIARFEADLSRKYEETKKQIAECLKNPSSFTEEEQRRLIVADAIGPGLGLEAFLHNFNRSSYH
jgi:hypothetical protein